MKSVAFLSLAFLGCACDDTGTPGPTSSSSDASGTGAGGAGPSTSSTASDGAGTSSSGGTGGMAPDEPCPNWPGWAKWDDWAPAQPFCYAVDPASTVAPIEWELCHPLSGMSTGCRQMVVDWPHEQLAFAVAASAFVEASGEVVLAFSRINGSSEPPNFAMPIVAEADGAVRAAALDPRQVLTTYAWFQSTALRGLGEGRGLLQLYPIDYTAPEALVGFVGPEPRPFVEHGFSDIVGRGFGASTDIWGTWDSNRILIARWGEEPQEVWGPAQSGYQQTRFVPFADFGTWHEGDATHANIIAWTPEDGAYPFISYGDDDTRGAEALGTDGVDLVWIQSEGRLPNGDYAQRDIMTSPFTTEPAALDPRRLRSYPSTYTGIRAFVVGCGYAAYSYEPGKVLVVRTSDGYWWELPSSGCTGPNFTGDFCFEDPYVLTCDELFLRGGMPMNIARVELDALGAPNAPD